MRSLWLVSRGEQVQATLGNVVDGRYTNNTTLRIDDSSLFAAWDGYGNQQQSWFQDFCACCSTTDVNTVWQYKYHDSLENCDVTCLAVEQIGNLDRLVYFISEVINTMPSMGSTLTLYGMYLERTSTFVEDCNVEGLMHNKESWLLVLPNVRTNDLEGVTNLPCLEH